MFFSPSASVTCAQVLYAGTLRILPPSVEILFEALSCLRLQPVWGYSALLEHNIHRVKRFSGQRGTFNGKVKLCS